jgi:shikimate kinase
MIITLIGMPGCGKSSMSRAIAGKLNLKPLDADKVIESKAGKKLHEIINEVGVEGFKKIEEEILLTINEDNIILATGGSAVYYEKAMKHFKEIGTVIYLYVSFETMLERLGDYSKRGIAMSPGQTIKDLYNERVSLYEKYADITINCDGNAYTKYRTEIIQAINKLKNK